nr:hypothetical protein [Pedobacter kyonggii]
MAATAPKYEGYSEQQGSMNRNATVSDFQKMKLIQLLCALQ